MSAVGSGFGTLGRCVFSVVVKCALVIVFSVSLVMTNAGFLPRRFAAFAAATSGESCGAVFGGSHDFCSAPKRGTASRTATADQTRRFMTGSFALSKC